MKNVELIMFFMLSSMSERRNDYKILIVKRHGKILLRPRRTWVDNVTTDVRGTAGGGDRSEVAPHNSQ
jgi:hypothetical protein